MSEKRCGRVWGHGAPIVVEDEGEDQGSPREQKVPARSVGGCQAEPSENIFHPLRPGAGGGHGEPKWGCGIWEDLEKQAQVSKEVARKAVFVMAVRKRRVGA